MAEIALPYPIPRRGIARPDEPGFRDLVRRMGLGIIQPGLAAARRFVPAGAAAPPALSYDATILAESSLVHFWKMNEGVGSGTVADSKGSLSGTVVDGVTLGSTGIFGDGETVATFDGSTGWIRFDTIWGTNAHWSVEYQCYETTAGRYVCDNGSFDYNANTGKRIYFGAPSAATNGQINFYGMKVSNNNNINLTSTNSYSTNTAYHVVFTYDGSTVTLYVNGTANANTLSSNDVSGGADSYKAPPCASIGCYLAGKPSSPYTIEPFLTAAFAGRIGKVAYYNAALSSAQVSAHYAARNTA